jgi:hypothetical protein
MNKKAYNIIWGIIILSGIILLISGLYSISQDDGQYAKNYLFQHEKEFTILQQQVNEFYPVSAGKFIYISVDSDIHIQDSILYSQTN